MPVIDDLQIRIQGDSVRAGDAIDRLVGKLDRLTTSLGTLNSNSSLTSLSNGVQRLSSAMVSMNNVKTADFTRLAKNIEKLSMLGSGKINQAAGSVHQFANALSGLQAANMTTATQQIADLAKGIAQLGYKSSTKAITNIPQLAIAMNQLMTSLSKAPKVSQNLIDMTNALAKLARTGAASGSAAKSLSNALGTYTKSTGRATKGTWSLASAIGKLYATYWMFFRVFRLVRKVIDISSSLTEIQNIVDVTFGDMAYKVEEFSKKSIEQFGMSELSVKKYASTFQAMGSSMGIDTALIGTANKFLNEQTQGYIGLSDSMSDVSLNLTKLTADMASFYNINQKDVADDLASIFTGSTRPLRQYGLDLTQATLQEWALKQGIDADIKSMTHAEKTMLRYQYVLANTGAAQGDFARTANTWANQVRILKQNFEQLGTIVGGAFINMLKPLVKALNVAMSHIIAFAQIVSNALGKIFGWTYEESGGVITQDMEDAAEASDDIAGGMSDAEKAAKKLKSHLLSIDELNVLEPDTDGAGNGSGGDGSGGASGGGASGGQWTKGESMFKQFESEIDTLYELGEYIGEALTKAMDSIDWQKTYKKAEGFGRGLAQFLNGLISPELFGAVGRTIASSLNTVIYASLSFAKTFNFNEFGQSIANGINEFFRTFDFKSLAQSIDEWVDGIWETITAFVKELSWKDLFKGAGSFIGEIDLGTITGIIGILTLKKIGKFVFAGGLVSSIAKSIATQISLQLGTMPVISVLVAGIKALFGSAAARSSLVFMFPKTTAVLTALSTWLSGTFFPALASVGSSILAFISGPWGIAIITALSAIVLAVLNWDSIVSFFKNVWDKIKGIFSTVAKYISDIWTKHVVPVWNSATSWFNENVITPIKILFEGFSERISQFIEGVWIITKAIWILASTWFDENVITPVVDAFQYCYEKVSDFFELLWSGIKNIWNSVSTWFNNNVVVPVVNFFEGLYISVKNYFDQLWTDIKTIWNSVSTWFDDNIITPVVDAFKTATEKIGDFFSSLWTGIKTGVKGAMNAAIGGIETGINFIVNGINKIISGFNKLVSWAAKVAEVDWGGVSLIPTVSLPRIPMYENGGYPVPASLFWAGENGVPEMIGTVGGKTAVASGAEITGIRNAVYDVGETETALLRTAVSLLELIAKKDMSVNIGGREVVAAYDERKLRNGYSFT